MEPTTAAGALELAALKDLITSNLGLMISLAFTAYGAYLILVQSKTKSGIIMLIVAAGIPLLTPFMDATRANFCPAVEMLGGTCGENTSVYAHDPHSH